MSEENKNEDNPFPKEKIKKVQIVKPGEIVSEDEVKPVSVRVERLLDRHNHKMEFLRTLFGLITITLQIVILAKIFNVI
jgi:hypothetical protein